MAIAKVIKLIGSSEKSFDDAIKSMVQRAQKTIRNLTGVKILSQKIKIKSNDSMEYRIEAEAIFLIENSKK